VKRLFAFGYLAVLFFLGTPLVRSDPLVVGDGPHYSLGGHLEILRDDTAAMTFAQVSASSSWAATPEDEPNPGFSNAVYWVRFQLESRTAHRLLLVFQYANVDFVDLFVAYPDGGLRHMASGDDIPFAERSIAHRYPLFPLTLPTAQPVWCYVQLRDPNSLFPLSVWDEAAFRRADSDQQLIIGLFVGLFLIGLLFNALFFLATRDRAYLYYFFFVLSYLVFELAFRGIAGEYLWPWHTWIDDAVEVTAASVAITMGLAFTRSFLQTKTWAPFMHVFLGGVLFAGAVNTLCTLVFPFVIMVQVTNAYLLFAAIVLIPSAFIVLRRGFRAARFYLAAWVMLLAGGIIFALLNLGLLPSNPFTRNALSVGGSLEMVLLFLAIVDRYLLLRRDGEKMQTERLEAVEKRLYSDTLTELPNRNRLIADLQQGKAVTIILVNIDHFKEINDCFGQKAGDHVIIELGNRIRGAVSERSGAVYRLHADEFAVVLESTSDGSDLAALGRTLVSRCQDHPYLYENETLRLDVSVGMAVTSARHLERADMALSVARSRKTPVVYEPGLEVLKRFADNLHWLHVIRESIEEDRIIPFFQPIRNNQTGSIDKYESLMRIRMRDGVFVAPGAFFPVAKKSKLYPELSRVIIEKTAGIMRTLDQEVSINVSLEDITHPDVRAVIDQVVSQRDIGPRVVFELLESEGIENYDEVSHFIQLMKDKGCKIAIDDFGAGYSNFAHILRLRVDYLKLDSSLIKSIVEDANARCIVQTIVSFARSLGIQTIAEFVHNEAVQNVVDSMGVNHSQGYFIGEPRPMKTESQIFKPAE